MSQSLTVEMICHTCCERVTSFSWIDGRVLCPTCAGQELPHAQCERQKLIHFVAHGMAAAYHRGRCNEIYDADVDIESFVAEGMEADWEKWTGAARVFIDMEGER